MIPLLLALACEAPPPPAAGPVMGVTEVRAFWSPDLRTWTPEPAPLARHATSLGLEVDADGVVTLTFLDLSGGEGSWWDRTLGGPAAGVLRRRGGAWERDRWPVDDPQAPALLDPQPFEGALWYVGREGQAGDPALAPTRIRRAPPGETVAAGQGLTDPAPVRFRDETLIFATEARQRIVLLAGAPPAPVRRWTGVTVPFGLVVGDELWLLAQQPAGGSRLPVPVLSRSRDGRTFSAFAPLLPPGTGAGCSSPVLAHLPEDPPWLLVCVQEVPPG